MASLLAAMVLAVSAGVLWQGRRTSESDAQTVAKNLAALLEEHAGAVLDSTNMALLSIKTTLESESLPQDDPDLRSYMRSARDRLDSHTRNLRHRRRRFHYARHRFSRHASGVSG
jgi:hypothetical protein